MTPRQVALNVAHYLRQRVDAEITVKPWTPAPSFLATPSAGLCITTSVGGRVDGHGGFELGESPWVDPFESEVDLHFRAITYRAGTVRVYWAGSDGFSDLNGTILCFPAQWFSKPPHRLLAELAAAPKTARLYGDYLGAAKYGVWPLGRARAAGWTFALPGDDYEPGTPIPLWAYVERGGLWRLGRVETIEEALERAESGRRVTEEQEPTTTLLRTEIRVWTFAPSQGSEPPDEVHVNAALMRRYIDTLYTHPVAIPFPFDGFLIAEADRVASALLSPEVT